MKTLGLIGGTSWLSTAEYYKYINQFTNARLGGNEFARLIIHSLNFGEVIRLQQAGDNAALDQLLLDAAVKLERAGAQGLVLCANTMHRSADMLASKLNIPIVHIAEATANEIVRQGLHTVSLLGTRFTMELGFFKEKLAEKEIATLIPEEADRAFIHQNIFDELAKEIFTQETKARYLTIIELQRSRGAQGVILGCTEIPLLLKPEEIPIPSFDTALIHARAAVEWALG